MGYCRKCGRESGNSDLCFECYKEREQEREAREEERRWREEERERQEEQNRLLQEQADQREEENARPNCQYCGHKFWPKESQWYGYCSQKCAFDDLGREEAFSYRQRIDDEMKAKFFETTVKEAQLNLERVEKFLQTFENSILSDWFRLYLKDDIKQRYDSCKNEADEAIAAVNNGDMSTLRLNWYPNRWHRTLIYLGGLRESVEQINACFKDASEIEAYNGNGEDLDDSWWGWTLPLEGMKQLPSTPIFPIWFLVFLSLMATIPSLVGVSLGEHDDLWTFSIILSLILWLYTGWRWKGDLETKEGKKANLPILKQFAKNYLSTYASFAESIHAAPNAPIEWLKP